ncbi:hypothetical protein VTK73DRAFT_194 [Phialemonium thermophilum]|uniref:Solute carrier family 40 member n=1 Tax=Phialemonium thermophilum TaxID=223376 RepID=A0ABR3XG74_9PEZI
MPLSTNDSVLNRVPGTPEMEVLTQDVGVTGAVALRLYTSHFLSTWNSRLFEAAVVYFLASVFPDNLLPVSIYAVVRNVAAIALTVPIGTWIDRGNRLTVVRISILGQRISVAASCGLFWAMLQASNLGGFAIYGLFASTVVLACIEKLCAGMNMVSVERDWLVVITDGDETQRRRMNARMRRIDLFCKLVGPLIIALVAAASVLGAVYATLGMNLASVTIEYICIGRVFEMVPTLRRVRRRLPRTQVGGLQPSPASAQRWSRLRLARFQRFASHMLMIPSLRFYFGQPTAAPSFALSLVYLTVLAFSGQMLTYLLASNLTLWQVGIIRAGSSIFELSATWIAPRLMKRIGLLRTGLWSILWQMAWLAAAISWLFYYCGGRGYSSTNLLPAVGLTVTAAFSRIGLWGFDLSVQNIVQDEIQGDRRGTFSTVESSFQNLFDLLSWVLTIIWPNPASFQWPVVVSVAAVYAAGGLYIYYLRRQRGHLIHVPQCLYPKIND